jgi:GNAT superfamily N-acetyltransferase
VLVHPEFRRRGIGIKLLDHMLDVIAAQKRGQLVGVCHAAGVGAAWCRGLGFEVTAATVVQELDICQVDGGLWEVPTPTGYRLDRWIGRVPDDLLESYAAARPAIRDAPLGQASYREADWTAARVRETEDDLIERGVHERVVVAIRNDSNDVVGVTGLLVYAHRPQFAYQNDTSVVSLHRGHGLGVAMKSAMMRWITQDRPELERVYTTTAAENNHMIRVNLQIGYQTRRSVTWVERPLEGLAELITR